MDEMSAVRSIFRYEMLLHKIKMKHDAPDDEGKFYSEKDMLTGIYNVMVFHRGVVRKGMDGKMDYLKMYRNLIRIKIRGIKNRK